jgi:hypothetical protein
MVAVTNTPLEIASAWIGVVGIGAGDQRDADRFCTL